MNMKGKRGTQWRDNRADYNPRNREQKKWKTNNILREISENLPEFGKN